MKNFIIAATACLLLTITQVGWGQAVQKGKAAKKEMKAEKKVAKARKLRSNAKTGKGLEIAGVSDPKTRRAKADKKMKKARKKELKSDAKELRAAAKEKTKKAAGID